MRSAESEMIKEIVRKLPNFIKRPTKRVYNSIPDNLKYGKVLIHFCKSLNIGVRKNLKNIK